MMHVKLSDPYTSWSVLRQTPGSGGVWGNYKFFVNDDIKECDFWVVYDGLKEEESVFCSPQKTILITGEPPSIKSYNQGFLDQFEVVITCHKNLNHPNLILKQQSQPWHVGVTRNPNGESVAKLNYDFFKNMGKIRKTKLLSVICSSKSLTKEQSQRMHFVDQLKAHLGQDIDIFGKGFNWIADKWEAIYF